jgi:hypothetical protein
MMTFSKIVILVCFMCLAARLYAQDDMPPADYVIEGEDIADFQWLPDGSGLHVIDELVPGEQRIEFVYDLETQTAQYSSDLLETEQASGETANLIYLSPDKRWAVYGVMENEQQYLALRNRISGQAHVMYEAPLIVIDYAPLFKVRWSEDSSAFYVYTSDGPSMYWYYISHFTHDLEDMTVVRLNNRQGIVYEAIGPVLNVFDIDNHGEILVVERLLRTNNPPSDKGQLVTLNMKTLTYEILTEEMGNLVEASFGPKGEIYYIDSQGLFVYTYEGDMSYLVNADINSTWIGDVEISTDGRYIAAIKGGNTHNLYILTTGLE